MMAAPRLRDVGPRIWLRIHWVRFRRRLGNLPVTLATEPAWAFALLLTVSTLTVATLSATFPRWVPQLDRFGLYGELSTWEGILVEAHGMLLDIVVVGILFSMLNRLGRRRLEHREIQNEIRDLAGWGTGEAAYRIVSIVKKLNQQGTSRIDLRDCILREANLGPYRVEGRSRPETIDLREASLHRADLTGANLKGANLTGANLFHARLDDAILERADLRGVLNLSAAQLLKARTLKGARLDDDLAERLRRRHAAKAEELLGPRPPESTSTEEGDEA